jgi:hypothetical protein
MYTALKSMSILYDKIMFSVIVIIYFIGHVIFYYKSALLLWVII